MRLVLVGGGKVGGFLAKELSEAGHTVTVIEQNPDRAQTVSDEVDAIVLEGDGTSVAMLKAADIHRADWLLALSGLDEVNLLACQLGLTLGAHRVLARLNNPRNRPTFDALGLPVVAVTDLLVDVISAEVEVSELSRRTVLGGGKLMVCELQVPDQFTPKTLAELELPAPSLVAVVSRGDEPVIPDGGTVLAPGDHITVITSPDTEARVRDVFFSEGPADG